MRGWGDRVRSNKEVTRLLKDNYPDMYSISKSTTARTVDHFLKTGSIKNRLTTDWPSTVTDEPL